jgi:hypothetical protein
MPPSLASWRRFVRWVAGVRDQRAWLFVPDDLRLRAWASLIAEQRRHSLVRDANRAPGIEPRITPASNDLSCAEQLSLFAPLSAVATATAAMSPWHEPLPEDWAAPAADDGIEMELAPLHAVALQPVSDPGGLTRRQTKDALRLANAAAARDLARHTRGSHAVINAELNRLAGIRRITEATVPQLEARLSHAERWLARV